jgi:hypothetical protein
MNFLKEKYLERGREIFSRLWNSYTQENAAH